MSGKANNSFSLSPCRIRVPHFLLAFSPSQSEPVCQPQSEETLLPHHLNPCRSCFLIETNIYHCKKFNRQEIDGHPH